MPRHKHIDPPVYKKISLPTSIKEGVDKELLDPLSGEPLYGAWSELVAWMLKEWMKGKLPTAPHQPQSSDVDLKDLL